ncbi:uncharacterized protein LOC141900494 [Tubulanus polymorphus]|uniref:uncharacterized protein LOC141900494 n=1 Tax=Tubulanus polymorphus TaxID=672921 RepID=UPI003DA4FC57
MYVRVLVVFLALFVVSIGAKRSKRQNDDPSDNHWCCINEIPATIVRITRVKVNQVQKGDVQKVGYRKCGAIGNKRCSVYDIKYRMEPEYMLEFVDVPQRNSCPENQVKCCKGYLNIGGNCLDKSSVKDDDFVDALNELNDLGILNR